MDPSGLLDCVWGRRTRFPIESHPRAMESRPWEHGPSKTTAHRVFYFDQQARLCSMQRREGSNEKELVWLNLGFEESRSRSSGVKALALHSLELDHLQTWWVADDGYVHGYVQGRTGWANDSASGN